MKLVLIFVIIAALYVPHILSQEVTKARAYLYKAVDDPTTGQLEAVGTVDFTQVNGKIEVVAKVRGLQNGLHGFHVHQFGNLTDKCNGAGPHLNPHKKSHGAPTDSERHVGDLGNINFTGDDVAFTMSDDVISFSGDNNIIGRGFVIHVGVDDLGKGNFNDSKTTGHAGARYACGIIGILDEKDTSSGNGAQLSIGSLIAAFAILLLLS